MVMKKFLMLMIAAVLSMMFLGCGAAQVYNVNNNAIEGVSDKQVSLSDVEKAILRAGGGLGWVMKKTKDGQIQGTLTLRTHVAVVAIKYNTKEYSINYVDSTKLDYNPAENTIHSNYNGWIQNLNRGIQVQLSLM